MRRGRSHQYIGLGPQSLIGGRCALILSPLSVQGLLFLLLQVCSLGIIEFFIQAPNLSSVLLHSSLEQNEHTLGSHCPCYAQRQKLLFSFPTLTTQVWEHNKNLYSSPQRKFTPTEELQMR